jgi:hypothetical protein
MSVHNATFYADGNTFDGMLVKLRKLFLSESLHDKANTGHWQSLKGTPHSQTRELRHVSIACHIKPTVGSWQSFMKPNLPWAEDHFQERVGGEPTNPGEQYMNWPWYAGGVEDHKQTGKFSHTYMERMWPAYAGDIEPAACNGPRIGIRYQYGDLNDLIQLLRREPATRQAYLPIWFPEDLHASAVELERVPCTLGYHLMLRDDRLHCFYPMRSVDARRYLVDDIYMAGRLVQWVIQEVKKVSYYWESTEILPGDLHFFASSIHVFEGDVPAMQREQKEWADKLAAVLHS